MITPEQAAQAAAPENIENYLAHLDRLKSEINELALKVKSLKDEKSNLEAGNAEAFQSIRDKIIQNLRESDEKLKAAKIANDEAEAKKNSLDGAMAEHLINVGAHEADKASFEKARLKSVDDLRNAQDEASKLYRENEAAENLLRTRKFDLDQRESQLNNIEKQQAEVQSKLDSQRQYNESKRNENENDRQSLDSQLAKIHEEILSYGKQRDIDMAEQKTLSEKAENERKLNEGILNEIKERSERLQELIINQKIMAQDIDRRKSALQAQEDKVSEMTITLKSLKDDLSKDSKPQEDVNEPTIGA